MAIKSRSALSTQFADLAFPDNADWNDHFDSFAHKTEDTNLLNDSFSRIILPPATALTVANGLGDLFTVPAQIAGKDLVGVAARVDTQSTSGKPTFQISRGRSAGAGGAYAFVSMLTTLLTLDALKWHSKDAISPPVIDGTNDDVLEGDILRVDCTVAGTATAGLTIIWEFG